MKAAVRTLARGWRRGAMKWYVGTTVVLGLSITLLLVISGLFAGMQAETQDRVADFYTHDVRVTPAGVTAIPPRTFFDLNATIEVLSRHGDLSVHYESQAILSRRTVEDVISREDDQVQISAGGREGDGDEVVALGALIGIAADGNGREALFKHMVTGGLPRSGDGEGQMPIVMSIDRFEQFITPEERRQMSWPPTANDLRSLTFQITAAKVITDENGQVSNVVRADARVVGLYDSGVDVLDSFTYVGTIEDARALNGEDIDAPLANVIVVDSGDPDAVHATAKKNGWTSQGAATFTDRYLGQLIDVLQVLSLLVSIFLFMLPAFLIVHGVGRQLETHNREIAVCQAIGVRRGTVRRALGSVVAQVTLAAILLAGILTAIIGFGLHTLLPGRRDLPLPMDFHTTVISVALALAVTLLSVGAALFLAFRSQARQPLSETLRTF